MRFLSHDECAAWCSQRGIPLSEPNRMPVFSGGYHSFDIPFPKDSGKKIFLAHFLYSLIQPAPETLLWLDDWSVWPSCQHMPLYTRFREALGDNSPLIKSPGHLVTVTDQDDAVSIIAMALLFLWDCHGLSASGRDGFFFSHDECGWFASRDKEVAEKVQREFDEMFPSAE